MVFREDGHLCDEALAALARSEDCFDELERLEIAEHLAFCDFCLQRYAAALEDGALLVPERSCQRTLWARIRSRALRLAVSRYATAVAAVTLALGRPVKTVYTQLTRGKRLLREALERSGKHGIL